VAVAAGLVAVPDLAGSVSGATESLGAWIYLAVVLLGRWTGFLRATLPFVAGSSGMPLRRLLPASVISALLWTTTFVVIGYVFSESFLSAGETATRWGLVLVLVTIAALVLRSRLAGGER
jgi:membrane protein DedA with SNARE-associated domain